MGDLDDLVGVIGRRGTSAEERRDQAEDRIRHWTRRRDEALASKNRLEAEDCDSKITYWSTRLRSLEERMAQMRDERT
jgi:hypothetical protein